MQNEFYVAGIGPSTPSGNSGIKNNGAHEYDVTIAVTITPQKLSAILAYIKSTSGTYNLNSYNCTDFGMEIALLAGLNLASAYGTWDGGGGDNPGQLGQNIRNMPLPTGALRTTGGGTAPSNTD